jgi:hypothetical protein
LKLGLTPTHESGVFDGIAAVSANDIFAVALDKHGIQVGQRTILIEQWNGTSWSVVNTNATSGDLTAVTALGDGTVVAVGGSLIVQN